MIIILSMAQVQTQSDKIKTHSIKFQTNSTKYFNLRQGVKAQGFFVALKDNRLMVQLKVVEMKGNV